MSADNKEKENTNSFGLKSLLGWLVGIVAVIAGIGFITDGAVVSGFATLAIPFFSIPMLADKWQDKYNVSLSTGMTVLSVFAIFVVIGIAAPQDMTANNNPKDNVEVSNGQVVVEDENNSSSEKQQPQEKQDTLWNKSGFMLSAQDAVKSLLKAPATAEFPSRAEDVEVGVRGVDNLFRLDSYVDSENSYGANIRSEFTVEGLMQDGEPQKIILVRFDGETVVDRRDDLNSTSTSS